MVPSFEKRGISRWLLLAGVAEVAAVGAGWSGLAGGEVSAFLAVFAAQAAAYLVALRCVEERGAALGTVLGLALVMRAVLLPLPVFLTTDLARYAHDGAVLASGGNPYARTPAERGARALPHADVGTVYPPGAQVLFAVAARAGGSALAFKLLAVAADLLVIAAWLVLARAVGWPAARCVAWAWHPMVLWAFAGSGHVDAAAIALAVAALAAVARGAHGAGGALLGAGGAVKLAPLALAVAWRELGRARWVALAVVAAAYAPFAGAGARLVAGPVAYAARWEHMGLVYTPLAHLTSPAMARVACYAGMAALLAACARSRAPLVERTRKLVGGALLLTPTLHPWYVCWVVPLYEPFSGVPYLVLSLTAASAYGVLLGRPELGVWGRTGWWWYLTWVPVAMAMSRTARGARRETFSG